jgi:hypothetical protein
MGSEGGKDISSVPGDSISSINVLHSPQSGHFPIHFGEWKPQFWHTKDDLFSFMFST